MSTSGSRPTDDARAGALPVLSGRTLDPNLVALLRHAVDQRYRNHLGTATIDLDEQPRNFLWIKRDTQAINAKVPAGAQASDIASQLADWFGADFFVALDHVVDASGAVHAEIVQWLRDDGLGGARLSESGTRISFVDGDDWLDVDPTQFGIAPLNFDEAFGSVALIGNLRAAEDGAMVVALEARGFEIHTETVALTTAFDESLQDCDDEFFSAFEQALSVGRTHANEGRYREALETFIHAKQLALEAGQFLDAAETAIGIGEIYALALDEPREAISALLDATDELEILSAFDTANTPVFADERATQGLAYGRRVMAVAIASLDEAQLAASTYQLSEEVYAALGDFGAAGLMAFEAGVVLAGAELNPLSDWDASRKHFAEVNANVRRACVLVTKGFYLLDDDDAAEACEQFLAASNELKALNQEILGLLADGLVAAAGLETQRRDEAISLGERTLAALDEIDRQHGDALYEVLKQEDPEARRVASQDAFLAVFVEQVRAAEPA